jgi:N6-adenosine-specific RNA methylase IME4
MSVEEICALAPMVIDLAADDCVLFMWATAPKLREALAVIQAWGFEYKTHGIWRKRRLGMGYYFRSVHELLLVATRGSPGVPAAEDRPRSVFDGTHGRHSKKPFAAYLMIERMYPDARKIELFTRDQRAGWDVRGNEVQFAMI